MNLSDKIKAVLEDKPWRDPRYNERNDWGSAKHDLTRVVAAKTLRTKAKDNHGYEYDVCLFMENLPSGWVLADGIDDDKFRNTFTFKWVLRIDKTPGSYCISSLIQDKHCGALFIDIGQNWVITNFQEVFDEALTLI